MKNILHIAAHMGGGAGKAISGILKKNTCYNNSLLLLEEPHDTRYIDICKKNDVKITISDDEKTIRQLAKSADVIILDWWCHPLFLKVFIALNNLKTRMILWSHINGLYYPYIPFEFLEKFDFCMFTSECTFENNQWTSEQKLIIKDKSEIIYGMGEFRPSENKKKIDYGVNEKFNIAYSGTLNFSKMNDCYPQVCRQTCYEISNTYFEFFGRYTEEFRNFFEESNVIFRGFITNIEEILTEMDIYCYLLNNENFATTENALLEAMASGLPIIVMDNPAERSIITHNENGFIAKDAKQVIQYIRELYDNEELRRSIGENARSKVIEKYSYETNLKNYYDCINNVLAIHAEGKEFNNLVENSAWGFFIQFCGNNYKNIIDELMAGDCKINLPKIFYESSKSSPKHFLKYYNDEKLSELVGIITKY